MEKIIELLAGASAAYVIAGCLFTLLCFLTPVFVLTTLIRVGRIKSKLERMDGWLESIASSAPKTPSAWDVALQNSGDQAKNEELIQQRLVTAKLEWEAEQNARLEAARVEMAKKREYEIVE